MLMVIRYISILVFLLMFGAAWASEKVYLEAGFETGEIQRNTSAVDGVYIQTLPNPQINGEGISSGSGGFGQTRTGIRESSPRSRLVATL